MPGEAPFVMVKKSKETTKPLVKCPRVKVCSNYKKEQDRKCVGTEGGGTVGVWEGEVWEEACTG